MLLASLGASACGSTGPSEELLPSLAIQIAAPSHFSGWFAQTEECSGLSAAFEAVDWYVVPGVDNFVVDGAPRVGMWQRVDGRSQIVVAGNYLDNEMVVRHEILHHLLGKEGHPNEMFVTRCHLTWESWQAPGSTTLAGGI